jgi:hypothetical protein
MAETILREENSKSRIYVKGLGQIILKDMSLNNDDLCMTVVNCLYSERSLNPPFKRLDLEESLLRKIINLSRDSRALEHKYREIEDLRNELSTKYSVNFS